MASGSTHFLTQRTGHQLENCTDCGVEAHGSHLQCCTDAFWVVPLLAAIALDERALRIVGLLADAVQPGLLALIFLALVLHSNDSQKASPGVLDSAVGTLPAKMPTGDQMLTH